MNTPRFSLAQLSAAQQANCIFAHYVGEQAQHITRLRGVYARKRTQLETLRTLMDEAAPDLVVRAADGRELVLRLPSAEAQHICCLLSQTLSEHLLAMEEQIVNQLLEIERDAACDKQEDADDHDLMAHHILALCMPSDSSLAQPALLAQTRSQADALPLLAGMTTGAQSSDESALAA